MQQFSRDSKSLVAALIQQFSRNSKSLSRSLSMRKTRILRFPLLRNSFCLQRGRSLRPSPTGQMRASTISPAGAVWLSFLDLSVVSVYYVIGRA